MKLQHLAKQLKRQTIKVHLAGGSVSQPVKIYTTLNIDNERFQTVTQDALIQSAEARKESDHIMSVAFNSDVTLTIEIAFDSDPFRYITDFHRCLSLCERI